MSGIISDVFSKTSCTQEWCWRATYGSDGRVSLVDGEEMRTLRCHLMKTPDKYVTFRSANPGQRFDAGIKYAWSSKSSYKTFNVTLLWRFSSKLDVWFWTPCAPRAGSVHAQAVFFIIIIVTRVSPAAGGAWVILKTSLPCCALPRLI